MKHYTGVTTAKGTDELWAVGGSGDLVILSRSGRSEKTISTADLCSLFFVDKNTAFVSGNNGEILLTADRGNSWTKLASGTSTDLESIFCVDANNCWAVGGKEGVLLRGGATRKWTSSRIVPDGRLSDLYFLNTKVGYAVGWDGLFLKTIDGGSNWVRISIPYTLRVGEFMDGLPNFETVVFKNEKMGCTAGWAVGSNLVACTIDGGITWRVREIKTHPLGIILGKDDRLYLVGQGGANLVSADLGKSWTRYKGPDRRRFF